MVKRVQRSEDGFYHVNGKAYKQLIGSRIQVWHGTAYKTEGQLTKDDLMMNQWHRIVSKKKHATAKKEKRLEKHGYFAKKGKFGYVKKSVRKTRRNKSDKKK
jgi:hypothetical protein